MSASYILHRIRRLALLGLAVGFCVTLGVRSFADVEEIAPASAEQIMHALGPDSAGLTIPPEKIPDIFTLTASRLDEDKARFFIQEPYKSGRWKGGKAVIEYARDLSYTMVSIYDKAGNRQRIYSVVNQPVAPTETDLAANAVPNTSPPAGNGWSAIGSQPTESGSETPAAQEPASATTSSSEAAAPKAAHRHHKQKNDSNLSSVSTPSAATTGVTGNAVVGFQWDDAQGAYVPIRSNGSSGAAASSSRSVPPPPPAAVEQARAVTAVAPPPPPPVSSKHRRHDSTSGNSAPVVASLPAATEPPPPMHPAPSSNGSDEWVPKNATPPAATNTKSGSAPVVSYAWDDKAGTYVPVQKSGAASEAAPATSAAPSSKHHKNHGSSASSGSTAPNESNTSGVASVPPPSAGTSAGTSPASVNDVPSTEDLLATNANVSAAAPRGASVASTNAGNSQAAVDNVTPPPPPPTKHRKTSGSASATAPTPLPSGSESPSANLATGGTRANSRPPAASNPSNGYVPITSVNSGNGSAGSDSEFTLKSQAGGGVGSTEDLLDSGPSGGQSGSSAAQGTSAAAAHSGDTASSPNRKHKNVPPPALPNNAEAAAAAMDARTAAATEPVAEAVDAKGPTGPDTTGADAWSPKKAERPPVPDVVQIQPSKPIQVAMLPKPTPAPKTDASIESLMKIAQAGQNAQPTEANSWSPKAAAGGGNSEAELNAQIEQARINENKKPVAPVVRIRHDVNNPEQGVLPANSFEKFSGPRYGRHWEYERRLHLEKHVNPPIKDYDFFVDEVDRKKEIHNVYYYKHDSGKTIPKLVAVERHEHVTFLSNYDVDQEDKGKISKTD